MWDDEHQRVRTEQEMAELERSKTEVKAIGRTEPEFTHPEAQDPYAASSTSPPLPSSSPSLSPSLLPPPAQTPSLSPPPQQTKKLNTLVSETRVSYKGHVFVLLEFAIDFTQMKHVSKLVPSFDFYLFISTMVEVPASEGSSQFIFAENVFHQQFLGTFNDDELGFACVCKADILLEAAERLLAREEDFVCGQVSFSDHQHSKEQQGAVFSNLGELDRKAFLLDFFKLSLDEAVSFTLTHSLPDPQRFELLDSLFTMIKNQTVANALAAHF